jgi:serine/threonine protein kinase
MNLARLQRHLLCGFTQERTSLKVTFSIEFYYHRIFVNCGYAMSTPDRSIENDKTLIGKNNSFRDQSLGTQDTITNENKRGEEFPEASHGMDLKSRYEIISSIGQGGMGHVYLAQDRTLARKVAIKRIKSHSDSTVRRFLVEARAIAQITHYNIVQIFDYGHDADGPYLILEYVDGGTLADLLKAGPLKVDQSINITCRLAEGLVKAHELGIIHRDIKPANILMTKDGQPKLTDFGLARDEHTDSAHTVTGAILGTIDFMSPEQLNDATATDARSDLWSLAVTFYQMVTGKSPRMIKFNLLPSNLKDFVIKALEDDPAERYQTAREFVDNLIRQINSPAVNHINMDYIQTDDLQTGECTNCHVVNESIRKYCRRCGNRLRLNCLECGTEMPVWDKICGECGGNQLTIMRAIKIKCENFIVECEDLLSNYAFDEAERVLQEIQGIDKTRFESYFVLFEDIQSRINQSRQEIQVYISKSWDESQILSKSKRYQEAVNLFKMLPDKILGSEIKEKMSEWNQKIIEIEQLSNDIERALKQNDCNGLLRKIERLISIGNTNESYFQIRDSLKERNANSKIEFTQLISNAERLRGKGDLKNAADLLANAVSILNRQITEDNHDYEAPTKLLDSAEKTRCLTIYQLALAYERSLECDQALSVLDNIPSEYNKVEDQGKLYEKSAIIQDIEISRRKIEKYDEIKRKIEKCIELSRFDQFHSLIQELQSIEDPKMEVYNKWAFDINLKVQSEIKDLDEFQKTKRDETYLRAMKLLNEGNAINSWNLIKDIDIEIITEKNALGRNETAIISSFELKILEHDNILATPLLINEHAIVGFHIGYDFSTAAYVNDRHLPILLPLQNVKGIQYSPEDREVFQMPSKCIIHDNELCYNIEILETCSDSNKIGFGTDFLPFATNPSFTKIKLINLCHLILSELIRRTQQILDVQLDAIVITVPLTFSCEVRNALQESALSLGIKVIGLIEEQVAIASYYYLVDRPSSLNSKSMGLNFALFNSLKNGVVVRLSDHSFEVVGIIDSMVYKSIVSDYFTIHNLLKTIEECIFIETHNIIKNEVALSHAKDDIKKAAESIIKDPDLMSYKELSICINKIIVKVSCKTIQDSVRSFNTNLESLIYEVCWCIERTTGKPISFRMVNNSEFLFLSQMTDSILRELPGITVYDSIISSALGAATRSYLAVQDWTYRDLPLCLDEPRIIKYPRRLKQNIGIVIDEGVNSSLIIIYKEGVYTLFPERTFGVKRLDKMQNTLNFKIVSSTSSLLSDSKLLFSICYDPSKGTDDYRIRDLNNIYDDRFSVTIIFRVDELIISVVDHLLAKVKYLMCDFSVDGHTDFDLFYR